MAQNTHTVTYEQVLHCEAKKQCTVLFFSNNFVKPFHISIIIGAHICLPHVLCAFYWQTFKLMNTCASGTLWNCTACDQRVWIAGQFGFKRYITFEKRSRNQHVVDERQYSLKPLNLEISELIILPKIHKSDDYFLYHAKHLQTNQIS